MKKWMKPSTTTLQVSAMKANNLTVESALYASGGHRGELTRTR